jgi:hypothetical protein
VISDVEMYFLDDAKVDGKMSSENGIKDELGCKANFSNILTHYYLNKENISTKK